MSDYNELHSIEWDILNSPCKDCYLQDLEVTTFDKELLQKEKEGLYKENEQLKQRIKELEQEIEDLRMDNIRLNKCCDSFMKELGLNDDRGITVWF